MSKKKEVQADNELEIKRVSIYQVKPSHPLFAFCDDLTFCAKNLYNLANYYLRQCFIFHKRENIPNDIQKLFDELNECIDAFNEKSKKSFILKKKKNIKALQKIFHSLKEDHADKEELVKIGKQLETLLKAVYVPQPKISKENGILFYDFLNYYFAHCLTTEDNPYKAMKAQTSQQVLRNICKDWKGFCKGLSGYAKDSSKYTGKPQMPKYKKKDGRKKVSLTNQQCKIDGEYLTCSFMPEKLKIGIDHKDYVFKEVRIIPMGTIYKIELVWDTIQTIDTEFHENAYMGIDLGVNNFATITNTIGLRSILINGKVLKSMNQYYNKMRAKYQSELPFVEEDGTLHQLYWSKKLQTLTTKRNNKMDHEMHKISKFIIDYCLRYGIGTIVVGLNSNWKQECNLERKNNQNFVDLPFRSFLDKLKYKAETVGIKVIEREESYTSQSSFLDLDEIPNYGKTHNCVFSGKRVYRGLYVAADGTEINADVNASYNILRKEFPHLFTKESIKTLSYFPKKITIY